MSVRIISRPVTMLACMREKGPFMESANTAWKKLASWLEKVDVANEDSEFMGVMHDDPETTPPEELRYDACVSVPRDFTSQDVFMQELPAGEYATTLHVGPYEQLDQSWGLLMQWLAEGDREAEMSVCFEVYRNDPRNTPPAELETELYIPLKPRK